MTKENTSLSNERNSLKKQLAEADQSVAYYKNNAEDHENTKNMLRKNIANLQKELQTEKTQLAEIRGKVEEERTALLNELTRVKETNQEFEQQLANVRQELAEKQNRIELLGEYRLSELVLHCLNRKKRKGV